MSLSFNEMAALKKDDSVWECGYGMCFEYKLIADAEVSVGFEDRKRVEFEAVRVNGGVPSTDATRFMAHDGLMHYGPKLYKEAAYVTIGELQ